MSHIQQLKKLSVSFLLDNQIPLTLDFYLIDFSKINDIFTFLKTAYLVFFENSDMKQFYEFIQYVLHEFYKYKFVEYKYVQNQKPQIPDCLKFEWKEFEFYLIVRQKPDGKLSIKHEFSLKLKTVHQGNERRYTVTEAISRGSFGKVYRCVDQHGNNFAMKLFQLKDEMDFELKALRHLEDIDQVITPLDEFNFSILGIEFGAFVMPFMKYTLKSFVEIQNPSEDFLLRVFFGLLLDLRKIHDKGCYHMDLKPENILMELLFNGNVDMKLADFGLAEILPEGTHYATTLEHKVTEWFRCPVNALAKANNTQFHISWIADFFALCVSMIYMCSRKSAKKFDFLDSPIFDIFRGQQYFKSNRSDDKSSKELNVDFSKIRIDIACRNAIKNPFFRDILMEYMNPASILRWYSELETNPNDNSVIMEVIVKIEVYFRTRFVVSQLKEHFKKSESDVDTPPRPRAYVSSP
jgi:serine/threonine protein kinase